MKINSLKKIALVLLGLAGLALANSSRAQTVIFTDNFDVPDTASLDASSQVGRHTGLLAASVVGQSGGIQNTITSSNLNLLRTGGGTDGRMRFCDTNGVGGIITSGRHDWASGPAGAAILTAGGMKVSFDWSAADNTSGNWISYSVGIAPVTDVSTRVASASTDSGILLRNNGGAQVFKLGAGGATATFDVTSLSLLHVLVMGRWCQRGIDRLCE
jgi:hypothetical protein